MSAHDHQSGAGNVAKITQETSFAVGDMTCSHCVSTVRSALERALPGAAVEIDLQAHRVTVAGDAATAAAAIRNAGYTPEPIGS